MPETPCPPAATGYTGKILTGSFSPQLVERTRTLINGFKTLDALPNPTIPYVAAWQETRGEIWYEFASHHFHRLFQTDPAHLPAVFRQAVIDRKIYKDNAEDPAIQVVMEDQSGITDHRHEIRKESSKSGMTEAVYQVRLPSGSAIWLKDQAFLEPFPEDDITLSVGTLTLVTKEMAAEEALRKAEAALSRSEKRFRSLFTQSNDAIFLLDAEGRILNANPKAAELTGIPVADLCGTPACHLIPPEEQPRIFDCGKEIQAGEAIRLETLILKETASPVDVDISARSVAADAPMIQAVIRDIRHRRQLDAERIKVGKFEMLRTLSGGLVHDVTNLLSVIMGNLSLAELTPGLPESATEILSRIETATSHLRTITRKMLVLAESGVGIRIPGNLTACLREALQDPPALSGIVIEKKIPADLPKVMMDRKALADAFCAIFENSMEAMGESGTLFVTAETASVGETEPELLFFITKGEYIRIRFQDTGCGMEPATLSRIFDPYFSTKERDSRKGTGLGLSLVYAVIKQHDGHVHAKSTVANGTEIIIHLPIYRGTPSP